MIRRKLLALSVFLSAPALAQTGLAGPGAGTSGGGGGGAITVANGADVAQGNTGDAAGASTVIGQLKSIASATAAPIPAGTANIGNTGGLETSGSAVTGGGNRFMGADAGALARDVKVGTNGGLLPGQAVPTSTLVTTVASASTILSAATGTRLAFEVEIETALTANLYLCFSNQTCSATVHDKIIASGAVSGTLYTAPFGFTGQANYFTTQASVLIGVSSWIAQ